MLCFNYFYIYGRTDQNATYSTPSKQFRIPKRISRKTVTIYDAISKRSDWLNYMKKIPRLHKQYLANCHSTHHVYTPSESPPIRSEIAQVLTAVKKSLFFKHGKLS